MSEEIVYSNIQSKPCAGCEGGAIVWGEWTLSNDGPDGDWCIRWGCFTNCESTGDCRCVGDATLRENRNDTDC